jgi:hypothetical protein
MVVTTALKCSPSLPTVADPSSLCQQNKELVSSEGCIMIITTDITVNRMARELEKI